MDLTIRINGEVIDGVSANSVKLTINNPDPLKFTEQTVSYSGTISVPRSEVNDRVFRSERFPGKFIRAAPYRAELYFGGFNIPFGSGLFRVRVTADEDGYSLELIENISKLSTLRAPVVAIPKMETPAYQFSTYIDSLNYAYPNNVTIPTIYAANGSTPLLMSYIADRVTKKAGEYKDAESQLVFKGAHDGLDGSVYAANYMIAENNEVATCFTYMTGIDTPFEIVQAFCKAFCWTYEFKSKPFALTLKPFINPSTISTYRVDWTGKIDKSSIKVAEAAGAARTYAVQVGSIKQTVGGYGGAISTQETVGESAFPVNPGAQRPYASMIRLAGSYVPDNYFNRESGYRATIAGHYDRFSPGWQVTAKMKLSYFDIQKMKSDALYFVGELNHWFYLRTLSDWDPSTGDANATLIAVKN